MSKDEFGKYIVNSPTLGKLVFSSPFIYIMFQSAFLAVNYYCIKYGLDLSCEEMEILAWKSLLP